MQLTYTLKEKDYLNFQLYHISVDRHVKKQRRNTQITVSIAVVLLGLYFLIFGEKWEGIYFLAGAVPVYFLCGFYSSMLYRFSLGRHVASTYRKTTPKSVSLSILNEKIEYIERGLTSNYNFGEIKSISNTRKHLFFRINETSFIILPKRELIDANYVIDYIRDQADRFDVSFVDKTN